MTLRFGYQRVTLHRPAAALGGVTFRPRPLIPVSLVDPAGTFARDGLLDTGSDDTVFPEVAAMRAGVDLTGAPTGEASGVGVARAPLRYALVTLRLTDGQEFREWPAWVGFTPSPLRYPLLGFAGCLQFFAALFRGDAEEVDLTVNGLYPGT